MAATRRWWRRASQLVLSSRCEAPRARVWLCGLRWCASCARARASARDRRSERTAAVDAWAKRDRRPRARSPRSARCTSAAAYDEGRHHRHDRSVGDAARRAARGRHSWRFLHELRVFDGTRGWLVDRNGEVRDLDGFELDDQLALAFRGTSRRWCPIACRGAVTVDAHGGFVLAPAGGQRPETVTLGADHRPVQIVRRDGEKLRTTRLDDWNAVAGVGVPFHLHEDNGDPNDAVTCRFTIDRARHAAGVHAAGRSRARHDAAPRACRSSSLSAASSSSTSRSTARRWRSSSTPAPRATVLNASRLAHAGPRGDRHVRGGRRRRRRHGRLRPARDVRGRRRDADAIRSSRRSRSIRSRGRSATSSTASSATTSCRGSSSRSTTSTSSCGCATARAITTPPARRCRSRSRTRRRSIDATVELPGLPPVPGHFTLDTGCLCEVSLFAPFIDQHKLLAAVPDAKSRRLLGGRRR